MRLVLLSLIVLFLVHCTPKSSKKMQSTNKAQKTVVYQVFTRLFGNTNTTNKPWGTMQENGVGKFADFTPEALKQIKSLGVTHIWYTGVLHHALVTDYTAYGISKDDPDVVKGRAGSPYAIKDYYNVNPDLAVQPEKRLQEFKALIKRTHQAGLKVIIDIVPNHVARKYEGISNPKGVTNFGAHDNNQVVYDRNNNFYYLPNTTFQVPIWPENYQPLGGENLEGVDHKFTEEPAKWTGNGSRLAQPNVNDWYETVKINYGIKPDGTKDFEILPDSMAQKDYKAHYDFWKGKSLPNSWTKFNDITQFWLDQGVDGFRFDMAEMVPVEFWSYLNSTIKMKNPNAFLLAEVYNPQLYRQYLHQGKMDYLYDKVELYDSLKHIMKGYGWADHIHTVQLGMQDIEHHMLKFLENHDEQRIASPEFVGNANIAKPAMVVSATISTAPVMLYFGQEVGEDASENAGFGTTSRTSIFDYIGVPAYQRWVNNKKFDGGQLNIEEQNLRDFYQRLLNFTLNSQAVMGAYEEIHYYNKQHTPTYDHRLFSYVRYTLNEKLLVVCNFDKDKTYQVDLKIPNSLVQQLQLKSKKVTDALYQNYQIDLKITDGIGHLPLQLNPLQSYIFEL